MIVVRDVVDDNERKWANDWYRAVRFAETSATDVQLVAELDGERVGLGRLVALDANGALELGGI